MSKTKNPPVQFRRFFSIRNWIFAVDLGFARDLKWDWLLENGCTMHDVVGLRIITKPNEPNILCAVIGPFIGCFVVSRR